MKTHIVIDNTGHSVMYTLEEFTWLNQRSLFRGKTIVEIKSISEGK